MFVESLCNQSKINEFLRSWLFWGKHLFYGFHRVSTHAHDFRSRSMIVYGKTGLALRELRGRALLGTQIGTLIGTLTGTLISDSINRDSNRGSNRDSNKDSHSFTLSSSPPQARATPHSYPQLRGALSSMDFIGFRRTPTISYQIL